MTSPTQRSLAHCRMMEMTAQVVEHWNPWSRTRKDLFGVIDIVACRPATGLNDGQILGIQACAGGSMSARMKKSLAEPKLRAWLLAGGEFEVWGWKKLLVARGKKKRAWVVERRPVTFADLDREIA